ncbi:type IVB secretion system protein IcmH/DotU [Rhodobacter sp. CZR27]|uniref:type IVB secretion system protein IcmH/DotU n=1 Tax=Rhodobacter sp. CZR27 TaxID=2033869 RepID=UPI000BBEC0F7|nr:type IVB secretion system protein IcmH/DotU [Rhodobacter sp. CZR27]
MTGKDDPFGLSTDAGRTRIRPPPAERQRRAAAAGHDAGPEARTPAFRPRARSHPNPLIASFAPLLEIAPELEATAPPQEPEALRVRLLDTLTAARDRAVSMGVPLARADRAAWFVAALVDDLALNTPWGGASGWPRQPLVTQLSGEVDAGTRFFQRIEELMRHPSLDPELLELAHVCLALGFRGKHRGAPGGGGAALLDLRSGIARLLRDPEAEAAPLSPHWQGVAAPDQPPRFVVPVWTVGLAALGLAVAIYMALSMQLSARAEKLFDLAGLVPPPERASIYRPLRETVAAPPEVSVDPVMIELLPAFRARAPAAVASALQGDEDAARTRLILRGPDPEVFRSARAEVNAAYLPLVAAIAATLVENREVISAIRVIGHTDSVPVQRSNPFASNQGLSEARATTIARMLVAAGVPEALVSAEGRADTEPAADNATREGRAQNRRVEIRIEKRL